MQGTGTGKSVAYFVPAIMRAVSNRRAIVVSTATLALQRQLVGRDLPRIAAALAPLLGRTPTFAVATLWQARGELITRAPARTSSAHLLRPALALWEVSPSRYPPGLSGPPARRAWLQGAGTADSTRLLLVDGKASLQQSRLAPPSKAPEAATAEGMMSPGWGPLAPAGSAPSAGPLGPISPRRVRAGALVLPPASQGSVPRASPHPLGPVGVPPALSVLRAQPALRVRCPRQGRRGWRQGASWESPARSLGQCAVIPRFFCPAGPAASPQGPYCGASLRRMLQKKITSAS